MNPEADYNSCLINYARSLAGLDPEEILKKLGIKHYKKPILKMPNKDLIKEFGKSAKNINKSLFIKNVIWQTYECIKAGEKPFDIGNLRSFWYYIKDTMDRVGANKKGDAYNIVSNMYAAKFVMIKNGKIFADSNISAVTKENIDSLYSVDSKIYDIDGGKIVVIN